MHVQRSSFRTRVAAMFASFGVVVGACAPPTPAETGSSRADPPVSGGRVIVGWFVDGRTLSPILMNGPEATVIPRIYDSLLKVNAKSGVAEPRLAEKVETSPDGVTITFTLREGLTWSDGSPLTGEDFEVTVEAIMRSKKTIRKNYFQTIVGADEYGAGKAESISGLAVSGRTITVTLRQPFCPALQRIGGFPIIPKSVFGKYLDPSDPSKNTDEAPENNAPVLASGPFKFKEWAPNDHVTLVRNDRFFLGKPRLDEWVYKVYPSSVAMAAALKTGEVDVANVQPSDVESLRQTDGLQSFSYLAPVHFYIAWNLLRGGKEFFQSKAVRQALAYGLDWDQIIASVYLGEAQKVVAHTPPTSWAYDTSGLNEYRYDAQKARQLLEQDGWLPGTDGVYQRGGQRLAFTLHAASGNRTTETLQQVIAEQYRRLGVEVTPKVEAGEALNDRLSVSRDATYGDQGGHEFDAALGSRTLTADPDAFLFWHSSQVRGGANLVGYRNAALDRALEAGRTVCSSIDRKAAYAAMDRQLNEDQPVNFGVSPKTLLFASKRLNGLDPGPFGSYGTPGYMWNVEQWWVKP